MASEKPHAVCVPFPGQGHMNPMLKLAKILQTKGFHITYVVTEFNHRRLIRSQGPRAVEGLPDFRFATIPDGLPYSDEDATQNVADLCVSTMKNCAGPFLSLLAELNAGGVSCSGPPVSCIVSDAAMSFTIDAALELRIPGILFWTASACGFLAYHHYQLLVDRGFLPLKDATDLTNGFLDTEVGSVPGLAEGMRLKDFPSFLLTTDRDEKMTNYILQQANRASMSSAIVLNTFEALEASALTALHKFLPPIYTIGPLSAMTRQYIPANSPHTKINTSLWKEDATCLGWLDDKDPESVVFVNFGSATVMSNDQLIEFAWGLANSNYSFLWVIRPDLVKGEFKVLPTDLTEDIKGRGLMVSWCPQEEVLFHPAVGVFLTHSGWNSTLESLSSGVPMICWPFFAEQQTNCKYSCTEWGVGLEINNNVKREGVEGLIRQVMEGDKGREMRKKVLEWKESAIKATMPFGSSAVNLEKMINAVLLSNSS